jgi:hypothetical protein
MVAYFGSGLLPPRRVVLDPSSVLKVDFAGDSLKISVKELEVGMLVEGIGRCQKIGEE